MNLWFRLVRVWLAARRRTRLGVRDTSVIRVRVWPHDLDVWGHMNGGRFVTLSDLGRLDLFVRNGLLGLVLRERWVLPMGAVAVRFRRPVRLFQVIELQSRMLGWDDRWGYVATDFVRDGTVVATVVMKGVAKDRTGRTVPSSVVLERLGIASDEFPIPESVRTWLGVDTVAAGRR
jgi:acyl-CoA thioesterase FadM